MRISEVAASDGRCGRPLGVSRWAPSAGGVSFVAVSVVYPGLAVAQTSATLNGPPVQVQPYVSEPGVPSISIPLGTLNPFSGADGGTGGTGNGGTGDGGGDGQGTQPSDSLNTMMGQPWGNQAVNNAAAVGINASALAATCVMESNCQNIGGPGTVAGAFQMTASTYTEMINDALAQNPDLASQIVPGLAGQMDPATESIAASEYLLQGAKALQNAGIVDPTVLQVRGYFNFGPQGGQNLATDPASEPIATALSMYTPAQLAANGITPGETVGQWQAAVAAKIGNAAQQSVLS